LAVLTGLAGLVIDSAVASSIRIAAQWERGVVFRLGRSLGVRGPGIYLIIAMGASACTGREPGFCRSHFR